jgi:hypothetical protein
VPLAGVTIFIDTSWLSTGGSCTSGADLSAHVSYNNPAKQRTCLCLDTRDFNSPNL